VSKEETEGRFNFPDEADESEDEELLGPVEAESKEDDDTDGGITLTGVGLFPGTDLSADQAREVMAGSLCRVIVVAGMPKSGKTTLMATLYELFQRGPFAGYHFAGSRTQLGFDERCHRGRTASLRDEEDMERTLPGDVGYVHLAVRAEGGEQPVRHLLFTDISGETFRDEVRNSSSGTRALEMLRRADHFVLLIDAEELASPARRQKALADARMVLESCAHEGMIGPRTHVQVAYARWDLVPAAETAEDGRLRTFLERVVEPRLRAFEDRVASLSMGPLAARPTSGDLELGHGVDTLLQAWVELSSLLRAAERQEPHPQEHDREMIRFQWREARAGTQ
jgi:hypothetical protein